MPNKTYRQMFLNKTIDQCLNVIGNKKASDRSKEWARRLLNKAYQKSGVDIHIHSIEGEDHGQKD